MYGARCDHEAGVNSTPYDTTQRVPRSLVKPIQEIVESMLHHIGCRTVVEPETRTYQSNTYYPVIRFQ